MANVKKMQSKYAQDMFAKMAEGNMGRDEGAELQKAMKDSANQAIQAQQKQITRQAMQYGQGDPMAAGANKAQAKEMSKVAADTAVKASGAAKDYQQKVFEKQQQIALQSMDTAVATRLETEKQNKELAGGVLEVAGSLVTPGVV